MLGPRIPESMHTTSGPVLNCPLTFCFVGFLLRNCLFGIWGLAEKPSCRRRVDSRKAQPLPGQLEFVFAPNAGPQPVRRFGALLSPRVPPLRTKYEKQSQANEKNDENNRSETPVPGSVQGYD